ncbi:MAG: sigma-70 family RNA polymerase sigma factor [Hyphomicrobiaceae bacterium]
MAGEPDDFAALFRQANNGDSTAYRRLLTGLTPWLRALVRKGLVRAGRSPDESEDIVQETLIAIHLKRQTWDETQPVEPWARAIASHKLIDFLRRRGHHGHLDIDDLADDLRAEAGQDVTDVIDRDRLLSVLPDRPRRIVEAISIQGLSAREIADELGMTEGAVRVALHRALKMMAGRAGEDDK